VLPHRPSKTPPVLRNHREGQVTMLNVTNPVGKDKSRWPKDNPRRPKGNTAETIRVPDLFLVTTTLGRCDRPAAIAGTVGNACTLATAWLIGLPRRAGRRLFAINDAEAGWRGWQVTETLGGLGRRYRDARWDALAAGPTLRRCSLGEGTDASTTVRTVDGWDDVHCWPWDGEG
jgi:hypothetical protein